MIEVAFEEATSTRIRKESIVSNPELESDRRLRRWRMQREAQRLLPDERVAFCMRRMKATSVDVMYSPAFKSAHYDGLMVCGSVWVCPLCAAKISEHRRIELEQAIASWVAKGGAVYLATYTIAHKHYDDLSALLQSFLMARKKARQGRTAQVIRKQFGIVGTVSVREVTWSKQNGWHPHCHELVFCSSEIAVEEYDNVIRERWRKSVEREGLSINEHGFRLDRTYGSIGDYVAKFGREPMQAPWSTATELTKGHLKQGRGEEHLTPFAMLGLIAQGHDELKPIFKQYVQCFKGKHQLVWSSGLRRLLLNEVEEKSDEELAQEPEQEEVLLGQLSRDHWVISISHIIGAPDLVIEVIIPHTAVYDRTVKREAYALAGIAEYWLIDIIYSTVEVLYLKEKTYRSEGVFKERAFLISNVVPAIAEVSVEQLFAWKPNIVSEL